MKKLQTSGYDHQTRLEVLKSILNAWEKILEKSESGERPLHRKREFNKEERAKAKEAKKVNWYKGKDGKSFDSVMMVPATPHGELKKIIESKAKSANLKIKIVEKSGVKLVTYLKRKYDKTSKNGLCNEKDCLICQHSDKNIRKCRTPSIVYKITCKECEKHQIKAKYYGETSFNGYTRGAQHLAKYRSKNASTQEKSALRKHAKSVHNDKKVDFKMEVIKSFKNNPLGRQVFESILIVKSKSEDDYPLNDKNEFNQAMIVTAKYTQGQY